ncbi:uncharacterized protein V1518DRAFT_410564 [Limtongia smithiae]|uniref:uncharacterized protein n=1 Tax=Limtongia smithiae TaxID=1125753 RepID=UPI0034CEF624
MTTVKAGPPLPQYILDARAAKRKSTAEDAASKRTRREATSQDNSEVEIHSSSVANRTGRTAIGPARHLLSASNASDSDSSDDEVGPTLPTNLDEAAEEAAARRRLAVAAATSEPAALSSSSSRREEWMTVPPSEQDWARSQTDPTHLKNKKFLSGRAAAHVVQRGADKSWTETEADRKKRVGEEMMGLRPRTGEERPLPSSTIMARDEEMDRKIKQYNDRVRGKSLLEQHQDRIEQGEGRNTGLDDPSKRQFDYDKDIASGGKIMSVSKLQDISKRAGSMDSRFSKSRML